MADIAELVADLKSEQDQLDAILDGLDVSQWDTATPAEGWAVRDQIAHLTYFDGAVTEAITDPEGFTARLPEIQAIPNYVDHVAKPLVALPAQELHAKWRAGRAAMYDAMLNADPKVRVPWYGPPMSVASSCTARIMETWAHGQDVADGVGVVREPSPNIKHVVHIGFRARPFAYFNRGMEVPEGGVRLELTAPDGETWTFGDSETDVIRGSALDMALLVTQRRHRADTSLQAEGPLADEFLNVAQAFAGKPGGGRTAGQFPKS